MLSRRKLLGCGAAVAAIPLFPIPAVAASKATRTFDLFRADRRIGSKSLTVERSGSIVAVSIEIDIKVRILGIPAYSYALRSNERWDRGRLMRLEAATNDNGTSERVSATRRDGGVAVEGTGYTGLVKGNPGTTTYWSRAFLERPVWISTQSGLPMRISAQRAGMDTIFTADGARIDATRWQIRGDIGELDLFYDAAGEWVGSNFEAKGEKAGFRLRNRGGSLSSLWIG